MMEVTVFQPFNMSEKSWGYLALQDKGVVSRALEARGSAKTLESMCGPGHKPYAAHKTETLKISRNSKTVNFRARGADHASNMARSFTFDMNESKVYDEVLQVLERYGLETKPSVTISTRKTT